MIALVMLFQEFSETPRPDPFKPVQLRFVEKDPEFRSLEMAEDEISEEG